MSHSTHYSHFGDDLYRPDDQTNSVKAPRWTKLCLIFAHHTVSPLATEVLCGLPRNHSFFNFLAHILLWPTPY